MSNNINSGSGSGLGADEQGVEYIDALDSNLSTFLAQMGTLVLILGVTLQEGLNRMQQDLAAGITAKGLVENAQTKQNGSAARGQKPIV